MKLQSYEFCQIGKNIFKEKKIKNILFHKSKYASTIWYSLLIRADKFHSRQIIILYLLNTQKSFEIN